MASCSYIVAESNGATTFTFGTPVQSDLVGALMSGVTMGLFLNKVFSGVDFWIQKAVEIALLTGIASMVTRRRALAGEPAWLVWG